MKRIGLVQLRFNQRKLYTQYLKTLSQHWNGTAADFYAEVHENATGASEMPLQAIHALSVGNIAGCWNWIKHPLSQKYDGKMGPATWFALTKLRNLGYEIVGLVDDDAYFQNPKEDMERVLEEFENPEVGAVGPIAPYRVFRVFENKPPSSVSVAKRPWTGFGCQIYRTQVLDEMLEHYETGLQWLLKLQLRADCILFMLTWGLGWDVNEIYLPGYQHSCTGINKKLMTAAKVHERMVRIAEDTELQIGLLQQIADPERRAKCLKDQKALEQGELRRDEKLLEEVLAIEQNSARETQSHSRRAD